MINTYYTYMMTNYTNRVLYTGVTNDLERRVREHKSGLIPGFTQKYHCKKLVYFIKKRPFNAGLAKNERNEKVTLWSTICTTLTFQFSISAA